MCEASSVSDDFRGSEWFATKTEVTLSSFLMKAGVTCSSEPSSEGRSAKSLFEMSKLFRLLH